MSQSKTLPVVSECKRVGTHPSHWEAALVETPADVRERVQAIHSEGVAHNTKLALQKDLRYFWAWAGVAYRIEDPAYPVPVEVVERFIADHLEGLRFTTDAALAAMGIKAEVGKKHRLSTIARRVSSLSTAHAALGFEGDENPCRAFRVRKLLRSSAKVAAKSGVAPRKKAAITLDIMARLLETCNTDTLPDLRDRALLAFGFATGGRRREEIALAEVGQLEGIEEGFIWTLARSKTDQVGQGVALPVLGKAGHYLLEWLTASGVRRGPIFRRIDRHGNVGAGLSPAAVAAIIQRRCTMAGLPAEQYGGHSLRSGFITSGGRAGFSLGDLMPFSGHKSVQIAAGYYRPGELVRNQVSWLLDRI